MTITPPVAKKVPHERTHHGDTFIDNYEWLRAKDDPEVIAYLEAEKNLRKCLELAPDFEKGKKTLELVLSALSKKAS